MSPRWLRLGLALTMIVSGGCINKIAVNSVANMLSGDGAGAFSRDNDIEFVGDSIPFAIKLMESVRDAAPKHAGIREAVCSSTTQYAMVYVAWPSEVIKYDDYDGYESGQARTKKFLDRSLDNCRQALEISYPGLTTEMYSDPEAALSQVTEEDVSLLYWMGATWLARISKSKEEMDAIGALPIAAAFIKRGLELDEDWSKGALHDLAILLEPSLPMPGGNDRAREHYARAVELAGGTLASPHVSLATSVSVVEQKKEEFVELMEKALAVDITVSPDDQLANMYAQEQARYYLNHLDDFFVE